MALKMDTPLPPPRTTVIPLMISSGWQPGNSFANQYTSWPRCFKAARYPSVTLSAPPDLGFFGSRQLSIKNRILVNSGYLTRSHQAKVRRRIDGIANALEHPFAAAAAQERVAGLQ